MKVAYASCPSCQKRFCVGGEYPGQPMLLCLCPYCHNEFTFGERLEAGANGASATRTEVSA